MATGHSRKSNELEAQHHGYEHLAFKNTYLNRLFTRIALRTTGRFYARNGPCVPISKHRIVKAGDLVHLTEAATMQFVANHTSIPVPKIYCSFIWNNRAYIVMESIQGEPLSNAWSRLSETARQSIFTQIRDYIDELRRIEPPGPQVQSSVGGSLRDLRIGHGYPRFGPFNSIREFHFWLREGMVDSSEAHKGINEEERQEMQKMITMQDKDRPMPVFTHGDLNPTNIIVRGEKIVGFVDWEFSGWFPDYWEYTTAYCGNVVTTDWQGLIHNFLDEFPDELAMEIIRHKWWGE
ncbi:hypothetical protein UVI_02061600 [Ustilaginoidea virens]|uniref:Aminoglycoside phosphotransferase domain-containing protein n=1 Tax=Ustilaginoidea virens TaxID=1159556 RepID=A0A1B5LAL8_USTVR|nr:hypothetical protein UVI_02061600 [Ustilaginoidea virens]